MRIIDISQRIHPDMLVYPGDPRYASKSVCSFRHGDACEVSELTIGSHCGTHIDAPLHMIAGGRPLESIPLESFVGPCRVLTIKSHVISEKMLMDAGIQPGERVLLRTDPEGKYADGSCFNPAVLSLRAAQYLAAQRISLIGIDSPSIENMESSGGQVHRTLLGAGVSILEGLLLHEADQFRYLLSALPLRLMGENGSPCRAVLICE